MRSHLKSSNYPRRRYKAHRRRDVKKISLRVLFGKSSEDLLSKSFCDLKKILEDCQKILKEDPQKIF